MKNYDDFELNCKDDCDTCEVKLECEYLTADGEAKEAALAKLVERDEKEEAARKAEELAEAADEATEVSEEQAEEEKPVEEITEEVTEENGETVETETVVDTSSPAEELAEAADEATEQAEEQAEEEKPVEEITEEVTEENGETVETETVVDTSSPAEELAEAADEATEEAEEQAEEQTAEEVEESILETAEDIDAPEEIQPTDNEPTETQPQTTEETAEEKTEEEQPATEEKPTEEAQTSEVAAQVTETEKVAEQTEEQAEEQTEQAEEEKPAKSAFKLTPPENLEELYAAMCTKRARKLIFRPAEAIYDKTFKVLGTDKKNEEGIKVKDILDAEIKQGVKLGYIDKFDGLKTSEIKEEYENDVVYEYAEQEFKKVGLIYDGKKIKVYVYDFDGKACHHVGYIDETEAADVIPYLIDKEKYSFALDGIITGGKAKRVTKDENGKITITKEKDGNIGLELDVTIIPRKD